MPKVGSDSGQVFLNRYSPFGNDSDWIGLHKEREDFARYISVSVSVVMWVLVYQCEC